jgi:CRISPR-associated protein Cas6/Cse3/CasE subtype I-E
LEDNIWFWLSLIQVSQTDKKRLFRYNLHKFIWHAYKDYPSGHKQPFLFFVSETADKDGIYCYVQSKVKPDWSDLLYTHQVDAITLNKVLGTKPVTISLNNRSRFSFSLHSSPVKNIYQGPKKRGLKVPMIKNSDIDQWIRRRSDQCGFKLLRYEIDNQAIQVRRHDVVNAKDIIISSCEANGILEIMNLQKFKTALTVGIGPNKIFGFGMLKLGDF